MSDIEREVPATAEAHVDDAASGESGERAAPQDLGEPEVPAEGGTAEETGAAPADAEELRRLLEDARARADENRDQVLRLRAELDNLRKRHERDLDSARKYALDTFVGELLQVRDSLELGLQAAAEESVDADKLREGSDLTLKLLGDVMAKFGVEQIDPVDQPFNPDFHQAMTLQSRDDVPPNTVVSVIQKGYALNGRLVRPALVIVSQAAA